jgi:branched-chain amino acid aminotransferase
MTVAFLNGQFFGPGADAPLDAARVPAFDAGFQHAVGLFETLTGGVSPDAPAGAWALSLDEHTERLAASATALGLSDQLRAPALGDAVLETIRRSGLARSRVRLTVTGGDLSLLAQGGPGAAPGPAKTRTPTVLIVAQPATVYPEAMFERGVGIALAGAHANPLNPTEGHKTLNYWWRLRELQLAAGKGAAEALVLSVTNHVCGGCVSNLLAIKDSTVSTPIARGEEADVAGAKAKTISSPVLPGVTRAWALDVLERRGLAVHRRMLSVQDLLDADEVILTNSSWGVLPVVRLEGSAIGGGEVGATAADLRRAWLERLPLKA